MEYTGTESRAITSPRLSIVINGEGNFMEMPTMPYRPISRCQAITDIIESVAQEQAALGRILSVESDKLRKILCLPCVCPRCILQFNRSVDRTINSVSRLEMILQTKLDLFEDCLCPDFPDFPDSTDTETE